VVAGTFINLNSITWYLNSLYPWFVHFAFLDSDQVISIQGHEWKLGSPHTAAVRRPSLQARLVLIQAVSIFPSSWLYSLILRFRRSTQFVWFLTVRFPSHFLSHSSYTPWARNTLPHQFPMPALIGVVQELAYLCCIHPQSPCISRGYDKSWYCAGMQPHYLLPSPH